MAGDDEGDEWSVRRFVLAVVAAGVLVLVARVAVGPAIRDPIHPVTVAGLVAGPLAALVMVALAPLVADDAPAPSVELWSTYVAGGRPGGYVRQGAWLQVLYGGVAGALYARVFRKGVGVSGAVFAALPASLVTALLYGVLVFLVAGAVYVLTDTVSLPPADAARWRTAVVLYAAYAATFGVLIGLWRPVVRPALGI